MSLCSTTLCSRPHYQLVSPYPPSSCFSACSGLVQRSNGGATIKSPRAVKAPRVSWPLWLKERDSTHGGMVAKSPRHKVIRDHVVDCIVIALCGGWLNISITIWTVSYGWSKGEKRLAIWFFCMFWLREDLVILTTVFIRHIEYAQAYRARRRFIQCCVMRRRPGLILGLCTP